jgi:hypothetical protein
MREFATRGINFTIVKVNEDCNLMFDVMQNAYKFVVPAQSKITVSDLAKAV